MLRTGDFNVVCKIRNDLFSYIFLFIYSVQILTKYFPWSVFSASCKKKKKKKYSFRYFPNRPRLRYNNKNNMFSVLI